MNVLCLIYGILAVLFSLIVGAIQILWDIRKRLVQLDLNIAKSALIHRLIEKE